MKRAFVNQASYVYGLNWDMKGLRTWQSKPSWAIKTLDFNQPFYERGNLADALVNGTHPGNPWISSNNTNAAPFDQDFYLILSVAVGGTNGWFPDNVPNKPWSNQSPGESRASDFARSRGSRTDTSDLGVPTECGARFLGQPEQVAPYVARGPEEARNGGRVCQDVAFGRTWRDVPVLKSLLPPCVRVLSSRSRSL